ncbi:TPA: hypothetical protein ACYEOW_005597 [Raoultella terrigena]
MSKKEFSVQEVIDAMLRRINDLEMLAFEQKIINEIHEAFIAALVIYLPEPKALDGVWRTIGPVVLRDIVERYAAQFPERREIVNKVLAEHLNFPKEVLNTAILMRGDTDSKVEPE